MAQVKSTRFSHPKPMPVDGRAIFINDVGPVATNPVANDTLDFRIPAGFELSQLEFAIPTALAASGLAAKVGFASLSGAGTVRVTGNDALAVDDDYFRAAGVFGTTAAKVACNFAPITFQEDVYLRITWTVTATSFAAGNVFMVAAGNANGPR